jgi:hypothetical protein
VKNKKVTYILLPIVVLIWGYAFFQIFGGGKPAYIPVQSTVVIDEELLKDSLQFKPLIFDFSDPFLNRKIISTKSTAVSNKPKQIRQIQVKKTKVQKPVTIQWPNIKYGGTVNSVKALVSINRQLDILNVNDEFQAVKIDAIFEDSIKVEYKGEYKVIVKNKF